MSKKLSLFEGMCIITGYGIGSGVLLLPYYIAKVGFWYSMCIMAVAFVVSALLHLMIADLALRSGEDSQIVSIFNKYLFKGKSGKVFTWLFFGLMFVTLIANLAIYISGSSLLINNLFNIGDLASKLLFYVFAAGFVFFGLKVIGVAEKLSIIFIMLAIGALSVMSFFVPLSPMPAGNISLVGAVSLFGKIMFVFVAFFSVPQVVNGLRYDPKKIRPAVIGGLALNMVISLLIVIFSLAVFPIPEGMVSQDYLAIVEWTRSLGMFAEYLGVGVTILAFITTFWSISLALSDIVKEQLKAKNWLAWILATVPSLLLTLILPATFENYINLAGGVIAILIVILPGPNSLYVMSIASRFGIKTGYWGALGVFTGDLILIL
ncbi:MAG: aromatic amino acid transport family protein, partial [Clostridia bacterium]